MIKNENVLLLFLKSRWKSKFLLIFFRLFQKFLLSLLKKKSRSFLSLLSLFFLLLLSLSFLSWKWKSFSKNKTFQRFDNFVKISLTCVKIRRFRLFNSSINSAISFVEKYDLANTVTIIVNRLSVSLFVSMFVFFRLFVKKKKKNSAFDFVRSSISRFYDVVFSSISSTHFDVLSVSSIFLNVVSFSRFFVSFSNNYRDSFFIFRFRFFSKISQKRFYASFHFSINLRKESVKYLSNFWKIQIRQRKLLKFFQHWHDSNENSDFARFAISHRDWKFLCVVYAKHESTCKKNHRKTCERCINAKFSCKSICVRICVDLFFVNDS